jgi:hypothetical protein
MWLGVKNKPAFSQWDCCNLQARAVPLIACCCLREPEIGVCDQDSDDRIGYRDEARRFVIGMLWDPAGRRSL